MLIVTGSLTERPETFEELRGLALEHVRRSRAEPGCLSHAVHVDCENPLRLLPRGMGEQGSAARAFRRSGLPRFRENRTRAGGGSGSDDTP